MRKKSLSLALLLMAVIAMIQTGCSPAAPVAPPAATSSQRYQLQGAVISVDVSAKKAVIHHEKVEDVMDAMTMSFSIPSSSDFEKLQVGKMIKSTLVVENNMMWLEGVEITGDAPTATEADGSGGGHAH